MTKISEKFMGLPAYITSMLIWGSIGIFRRYIPLPDGFVALSRGIIGALFLGLLMLVTKKRVNWRAARQNLIPLAISCVCLGMNWMLFFKANMLTTVAAATVCYYMAPVLITLAAPFVLKERLTPKKVVCVFAAVLGVVFVSGLLQNGENAQMAGIFCGLGAACLYATVMLMNKLMKEIDALDRTFIQLSATSVVLFLYSSIFEFKELTFAAMDGKAIAFLLLIGIVHTGVAFIWFFGSIPRLSAQTSALCSYIDPVVAILLSAILLNEPLDALGIIGAVLVIGAALVGELKFTKNK